jgi:hypothetical protein
VLVSFTVSENKVSDRTYVLGALISGDEGTLSESELAESSDSDPELDESSVSRSDSDFFVGSNCFRCLRQFS